jgi:hypothetical protein
MDDFHNSRVAAAEALVRVVEIVPCESAASRCQVARNGRGWGSLTRVAAARKPDAEGTETCVWREEVRHESRAA